jgi:hypothetical protein
MQFCVGEKIGLSDLDTVKNNNNIIILFSPTLSPRSLQFEQSRPQAMPFDCISAVFAFAAACIYVAVAVFTPLSEGMLGFRGWTATKPAWADPTAKPPALWDVTSGPIVYDWLHARLFAVLISLAISAIVGLQACFLVPEAVAPSKSTFLHVLSSMATNANKSLRRSFCLLLGSCALAITAKLQ